MRAVPALLRLGLITACLAGLPVAPALRADVLVDAAGARVEVTGSWLLRGETVVFREPSGVLTSMRLLPPVRVVLADESAAAPTPNVAPQARRALRASRRSAETAAVFVLTDADVGHVDKPEEPPRHAADPRPASDGLAANAVAATAGPSITSWRQAVDPQTGRLIVTGTVRNAGAQAVDDLRLGVRLEAEDGALLQSEEALLTAYELGPRKKAEFRAVLLPLESGYRVAFDLSSG